MDYAEQQRSPVKHLTGLAVVLLFHILVGYALVNGLARKMIEVIKSPMETKIIEEANKSPPDDTPPPPPPKLVPLPPAFVPPPEVQIQAPAAPQPTISNTTSVVTPVKPPPAPVVHAPPSVGVACPNSQKVRSEISYPASAKRDELEGNVLIEFTVAADGAIKDLEVKSSTDRVFNNASINAVRQFKCNAQGRDVRVSVPFVFKLVN
ncbi:MAG: energy transducer TonB [Proteobacteria bacterium]|nr:energy transducer TonB [Pseudomonadota bacterium]